MSFGTFTLTGNEGIVGGAPAMGKVIVRVVSSTSQVVRDTAGNKVWHGPKSVPLRSDGSWSVDLPSDSTTGNSTTIAYEVSSDLKNVANLPVTTFYARPIASTLPFTPLINETVIPLTPNAVSQATFDAYTASNPGATQSTIAAYVTGAGSTKSALDARYLPVITPELYGAKGDYDPNANTGTDDTAAWQSAINACLTLGARFHAPAKNYRITNTLTIIDAKGFELAGCKGGLQGGLTALSGTWLHYTGATTKPMLRVEGTSNFVLDGISFHGRNIADGIRIVSDNSPSVSNHTYRNSFMFRVQTGVYINDGAGLTQSDQMLFENVRMAEVVNICFRTNSVNVTGIKWLRCTTALASSADNTVHYQFDRGMMLSLDSCFGAFGQDFVRIAGPLAGSVTVDTCQSEGTTNPAPAFIRIGATSDAGFQDTTTMRNCIPDGPIILAGGSRRVYSVGNTWHASTSISVTGPDTRFVSVAETLPSSVSVTGANALLQRPDAVLVTGGATPSPVVGANGSTSASIIGNTYSGTISFTTKAGLAADTYGLVVAITSQIGTGYTVQLTPGNAAAAAALAYADGFLSSQWALNLHNPPAAATPMVFYYRLG